MSKRFVIGIALVAVLAVPAYARAHEGHAHKVMGTITMRHDNHLEVKTKDGKTVTITLNEKTSIVRGKQKLDLNALKEGERVAVDVGNGKAPMTAREVKLGAAVDTSKK
jgi:preprotein translocase subunit SecA